jgi:hypothetical protein
VSNQDGGGFCNVVTATLDNTIIANSQSGGDVANFGALDGSHNLVEDGSDGLPDTITGDPELGPLSDNGGPTLTQALLPGSPAIDAGSDSLVPDGVTTDQRGAPFTRFAGTVDIGAYERQTVSGLSLVVDTTADENDGNYGPGDLSLREAVGLANGSIGPDTITFDPTVFATPQTITLTQGEMLIIDSLTITGPAAALTISGNNTSRIFDINDGNSATTIEVTVGGLTLIDGQSGGSFLGGGAISNAEDLTLTGSTLARSVALGDSSGVFDGGGALLNTGTATLTDCTLSGNVAFSAAGGGIFNAGTMTLTHCTLSYNEAEYVGSAGFFAGDGGGILNYGTVTLADCTLSGNETLGAREGGGGIFNANAATLTDCTLSQNDSDSSGGGLTNGGVMTLTDCTLTNNFATIEGGGISNGGMATLTGCNFTSNAAGEGGGFSNSFTATLASCTFSDNTAGFGGAFQNDVGNATLTACTLSGNSADFDGGGLYNSELGSAMLANCILSGNLALFNIFLEPTNGGGIFNAGQAALTNCTLSSNGAGDNGGGVDNNGSATLTDCTLSGNAAFTFGGGLYNDGDVTLTRCTLSDNENEAINNSGSLTLTNCTLSGNSAVFGGGLVNSGTAVLSDCIFSGNSAIEGGAFYNLNSAALTDCTFSDDSAFALDFGSGGGAVKNLGTLTLTDCTLSGNSASEAGGGLLNSNLLQGGTATLTNCTLSGNSAQLGSGLYNNDGGMATLTNCTLAANTGGAGAGLFNSGAVTVTSCILSDNSASDEGGGLYNDGIATLANCTLSGNSARLGGAGLSNVETLIMTSCSLLDNSAGIYGGGLVNTGTATLMNCTLSGNSAALGDGGAIDNLATLVAIDCTLSANSAGLDGGGLLNSNIFFTVAATLTNCTLSDNSAVDGGGIYNDSGPATLNNTIVANSPAGDIFNSGTLSGGHNLIEDGSGGLADTITGDPMLGPLADNGGPTFTQALLPGSPALNAGANPLALDAAGAPLTFDQRGPGFARFVGTVDIGAFEFQDSPPIANAGGPYSVNEGSSVILNASGTTDPDQDPASLTYEWDFDGDGQFDDAVGIDPTFSAASLDGFAGSTVSVRLRVTDNSGLQSFDTATITINNVAPAVGITGPATGVRGQPRTFTLSASDPSSADQAAGFTYAIDFDGDGTVDQIIGPGASGQISIDHIYDRLGTFTLQVTATDKDGGTSSTATQVIQIKVFDLQDDPGDAGTNPTALVVGGSAGDDTIAFKSTPGSPNTVTLFVNGVRQGRFAGLTRLIAYGGAGNDTIRVAAEITLPTLLDGGAGNDTIKGGNGNNIILGGTGSDMLTGGNDRDILIGGLDADRIHGNGGDDILIGGTTLWDANPQALCRLMDEWSRTDAGYLTRIRHLRHGGAGALNGSFLLNSGTVFDDAAIDVLFGDSGSDWFFAKMTGATSDRVKDRTPGEVLSRLS